VKALLRRPALHWALALVVGGVFLYACSDKILEPRKFAAIVYQYQVVGPSARARLPAANLAGGHAALGRAARRPAARDRLWRREAAAVAGGLLVMFLAAIGIAHRAGRRHRQLRLLQRRGARPHARMAAGPAGPGAPRRLRGAGALPPRAPAAGRAASRPAH
jgi:hypothetical protein